MQQESTASGYAPIDSWWRGAAWFLQFCMGMSFFSVAPLFPLIMDSYGIEGRRSHCWWAQVHW